MTAPRPLTERALQEAARVARQEGVTIRVARDPARGWVYEFAPAGVDPAKTSGGDDSWEGQFD